MLRLLVQLIAVGGLLLPLPAKAQYSNEHFCQVLEQIQKDLQEHIDTTMDPVTKIDDMIVLCDTKVLVFKKYLASAAEHLRAGWQEHKQAQWNDLYCNDAITSAAIADGWTIATELTTTDGKRLWYTAECSKR